MPLHGEWIVSWPYLVPSLCRQVCIRKTGDLLKICGTGSLLESKSSTISSRCMRMAKSSPKHRWKCKTSRCRHVWSYISTLKAHRRISWDAKRCSPRTPSMASWLKVSWTPSATVCVHTEAPISGWHSMIWHEMVLHFGPFKERHTIIRQVVLVPNKVVLKMNI